MTTPRGLLAAALSACALLALACPATPRPEPAPNPESTSATSTPAPEPEPIAMGSAAGLAVPTAAPSGGAVWLESRRAVEPAATPDIEGSTDAPALPFERPQGLTPGQAAPAFHVTTLDGTALDSRALYGTKPVLLVVWATWCGPCVAEAPTIQALYEDYGEQVQFIAVSADDPDAETMVREFLNDGGLRYPVAMDPEGKVSDDFGASAIPLSVMIGRDGTVIEQLIGFHGDAETRAKFEESFGLGEHAGDPSDGIQT